ncbi:GPI7 [Enterospora canceri]|uniref:GPI7 n=1 Tax=Enterospora canceri TaxID=1081671 RepID=A0A1Y1S596_9MICR|nr:GPI7 [Enterospora canceri]
MERITLSINQLVLLVTISAIVFMKAMFYVPNYNDHCSSTRSSPQYSKLVYFVIDGLRYDGIMTKDELFVNNTPEKRHDPYKGLEFYRNNYDFSYSKFHRKYVSIAGKPTATTSRIFSMITGKASNQLDYLFAFLHMEQKGDSLIKQAINSNKIVKHYGDRMWVELFPEIAEYSNNFDPYGKHKLKRNEKQVYEAFLRDLNHCDIQFMHLIAGDSTGHMHHNIDVKDMRRQQKRYNRWIREIYNKMEEDTLLVITSDHGVTNTGDHGSFNDMCAASICVLLSKKEFPKCIRPETNKVYDYFYAENTLIKKYGLTNIIHQDDILPTVCYLTGYAMPSNLCGSIIDDFATVETLQETIRIKESVALKNRFCIKSIRNKFKSELGISVDENPLNYSHYLSHAIREDMFKINKMLGFTSIAIQLAAMCYSFTTITPRFHDLPGFIFIFYDCISYWFFSYRDLYYVGLLAFYSVGSGAQTLIMLLIMLYLKTDKSKHWEDYRADIVTGKYLEWISPNTIILLFMVVYLFTSHPKIRLANLLHLIHLSLPGIYSSNTDAIRHNPNIYGLLFVHFTKHEAYSIIMIYLIINRIRVSNRSYTWIKFIMAQLVAHLYNFDYQITSINFDCAHRFTYKINYFYVTIGFAVYFFGARYLLWRKRGILINLGGIELKNKTKSTPGILKYLQLIQFLLVVSSISAVVMHGDVVWTRFFADRFVIQFFNTVFDLSMLYIGTI